MSDFEDDDFMHEDEFEFEYDDEDEEVSVEGNTIDLENRYYRAKEKKDIDIEEAINDFLKVVETEQQPGEWGFKGLKQACKLSFKQKNYTKCFEYFERLLKDYSHVVTRNYAEKSINNLLDLLSSSSNTTDDFSFLERVYSNTLKQLENIQNERLFIKTNLKLAKLWLDRHEFARMQKIVRRLREHCECLDDSDDLMQKRGTHLLEIYALEIQMYTEMKNNKKLKQLYQQCLSVKAAIPHPRIMGIVYECGGKMHMSQSNPFLFCHNPHSMRVEEWTLAQQDFFEAFKNYDEAGSQQRINCLKYLVLANMLAESNINPFDSQETKPYKNDAQIMAMTNLVSAYQRKEIWEFEKILSENNDSIMQDAFIREYIEGVLWNIRSQVLMQLVKPYRSVDLKFLSKQIGYNIAVEEVQELLIMLIMNDKLDATIDQLSGKLYIEPGASDKIDSLLKLSQSLQKLHSIIIAK